MLKLNKGAWQAQAMSWAVILILQMTYTAVSSAWLPSWHLGQVSSCPMHQKLVYGSGVNPCQQGQTHEVDVQQGSYNTFTDAPHLLERNEPLPVRPKRYEWWAAGRPKRNAPSSGLEEQLHISSKGQKLKLQATRAFTTLL